MAILGILLLAVYFAPLFISLKYRKDLNQIKKELEFLKGKLETASAQEGPVSADSDSDKTEKEQPGEANQPVEEKPFAESITPGAESSHAIRKKDRKSSARAGKGLDKKLEKSFLDKGTGIFGAAIVVLGAGFLSIYAAVRLSEFYRFILLLGLSAVPAVFSFLLRGKKKMGKAVRPGC